MRQKTLLSLSLLALGVNSALAEGFIEHEKHVHGQAQLNIAIEKNEIEMEFSSPAMNLLGFEYKPSSDEDKQQLAQAVTTLRQGGKLFTIGGCKLKESEVSSELLGAEHANGHSDDHSDGKHESAGHDHEEQDHEEQDQRSHSDFLVHYHFHCVEGIPTHIQTSLFAAFPRLENVTATVLSRQQLQLTLNKQESVINLR